MVKDISEHNDQIKSNEHTLKLLHKHFPQCFTKEGNFDLKVFSSMVKEALPVTYEGYGLDFLGKNYASLLASTDTTTVIVPDEEHNSKPENQNSENIYISGDNLDGLKHLLKSYSGRVKCIYIDPPYNTGTDGFVYNDTFKFTEESLQSKLDVNPDQAKRILDLARRGSASHSAWLMFMLPRLLLAKDLLSKDGVIFVSIDDNEQANLKLLCDYVFGEENFIGNIIVKSNPRGSMSSGNVASLHEYVLIYSKEEDINAMNGQPLTESMKSEYKFEDSKGKYRLLGLRMRGGFWRRSDRPKLYYPLYVNPNSGKVSDEYSNEYSEQVFPIQPSTNIDGIWRWNKAKFNALHQEVIGKKVTRDGEDVWDIFQKDYFEREGGRKTKVKSIWDNSELNYQNGTEALKGLDLAGVFDYPKPIELVDKCLSSLTLEDGDIILDFFSGSATTAHSVLKNIVSLAFPEIKYILVQIQESTKEGSVAKSKGFETIDQIGMERIKRAAAKIKAEHPDYDGDLGFKHYTLQEPSDNTWTKLERFDPNVMFGENILDEFGRNTVLQTWYVRDGYGFNPKVEEVVLDTYTAYHCGSHLYFLDPGLTEDDMVSLVRRYHSDPSFNPDNLVIFGYSFNFTETELLKKNLAPLRDDINNLKINMDIRY
ncbi:MAG: site-specific DNA-methyltransferase [Bacteroidales bacterium]|nr:site-specific DNA-methyltransferase [Bacteroidales bacterium]